MWRTELATIASWQSGNTACTIGVLVREDGPTVFEALRVGSREVYARTHETRDAAMAEADDLRRDFRA
jgi:hypothetical protein